MALFMRLHKSRYSAFPSVRPPKFHSCITSPLKQPIKSNQWFATATTKPKVKPRMTQEDAADIMQKEMFSDEIPKVPSDTLKVVIGAGEASSAPPLGPILGQYQINIVTFCKEFNAKSVVEWEKGVPLPVTIKRFANKSYEMVIKPPTLRSLLNQVINENDEVTIEDLFWVCQIHSRNQGWHLMRQGAPCLFGTLNSWHKRISILDKKVGPKTIKFVRKREEEGEDEEETPAPETKTETKAEKGKGDKEKGEKAADKGGEKKAGEKEKSEKDRGEKKEKKK